MSEDVRAKLDVAVEVLDQTVGARGVLLRGYCRRCRGIICTSASRNGSVQDALDRAARDMMRKVTYCHAPVCDAT